MDEDWQSNGLEPGDQPFDGQAAGSVPATIDDLHRAQSELWAALRREEDPDLRMGLLSRLSENRAMILELSHQRDAGAGPDAWFRTDHADPADHADHGGPGGSALQPGRYAYGPPPGLDDPDLNGGGPGGAGQRDLGLGGLGLAAGTAGPPAQLEPGPRRWPATTTPALYNGGGEPPPPPQLGDRAALDDASAAQETIDRLRAGLRRVSQQPSGQRTAMLAGALLSVLAVLWLIVAQPFNRDEQTAAGADAASTSQPTAADRNDRVAAIQAVLAKMGLTTVQAELQPDGLHLTGTVPTEAQRGTVVDVVQTLASGQMPVISELIIQPPPPSQPTPTDPATARAGALQNELNRLVAATPLIFETGQAAVTDLHARILNNVANVLKAYPGIPVRIVGYTDTAGKPDANTGLSVARAQSTKAYLVSQGIGEGGLITEGRGQAGATGSQTLASLERRVAFEVVVPAAAPAGKPVLKVALVAPSARNDLAFTQSMVDAINTVAAERGNVQVDITDSTFVPADAAAAIKRYAEGHYNLVIAHGVEFGADLLAIVKAHPEVTFAWGTATDTFGLPNLYAYDAASEEGGYVMGAMAALLSAKNTVGEVGPIEVADASRYINGFKAGAVAQKPGINVPIIYTGSFSDITLASEAARAHLAAGADVLTGSAEMVVGAVAAAKDAGALWFGTQSNQSALAPNLVVASQVYHWEVVLRPIVADIDAGRPNGRSFVAHLANGGLVVELNPGYALPEPVKARADQLINDIKSGALVPPGVK